MSIGNAIAGREARMAKITYRSDELNFSKIVLNADSVGLTPDQFYRLCCDNPELRLELTARKEIIVMHPTNSKTGLRNAEISFQLAAWAKRDGRGVVFDSNTGFMLPNGASRSPDASWILRRRWDALTSEEQEVFAPICPDFVIELWSRTNTLSELQFKMDEYIANGAGLGFLVHPPKRQVYVYRPDKPVVKLDDPVVVSGDPELPGFTLDLTEIWK
jgi:Uma2 family endonuclease